MRLLPSSQKDEIRRGRFKLNIAKLKGKVRDWRISRFSREFHFRFARMYGEEKKMCGERK